MVRGTDMSFKESSLFGLQRLLGRLVRVDSPTRSSRLVDAVHEIEAKGARFEVLGRGGGEQAA